MDQSCALCQKYEKIEHTEPIASLPITQSSLHWHLSSCSSALNWCLGEKAQRSIFAIFANFYWLRIIELWLKDANSFAESDFPENNPNSKFGLFYSISFFNMFIKFSLNDKLSCSERKEHFVDYGIKRTFLWSFEEKLQFFSTSSSLGLKKENFSRYGNLTCHWYTKIEPLTKICFPKKKWISNFLASERIQTPENKHLIRNGSCLVCKHSNDVSKPMICSQNQSDL